MNNPQPPLALVGHSVSINTAPGTRVWISTRASRSFGDTAIVARKSLTFPQDHLVVVFSPDQQPDEKYRFRLDELQRITNERLPMVGQGPFPQVAHSQPLTVPQARTLAQAVPNLFTLDDGTATVDLTGDDHAVNLQLQNTHVRVMDSPFLNCLHFAVGNGAEFLSSLPDILALAQQRGRQVLSIGDPGADVDLWGVPAHGKMEVTHGSRRYIDGNGLWASVMGAGNWLVVHARYALCGSGYGQVVGSFAGGRI